jgi:hypothetical protein
MTRNTNRKSRKQDAWKQLADGQLDRAIFLDFEQYEQGPPVLAGVLVDGRFDQVVFDDRLASAADHNDLRIVPVDDWAQDLVELATRDNRRVVAFSETEIESLAELEIVLPPNLFVNALVIAKEWRRTFRSEALRQIQLQRKQWKNSRSAKQRNRRSRNEGNRWIDYARLGGIETPHMYAHGQVTRRLNAVIGQLSSRGDFQLLTRTAKSKWTNLLKHNRFDVEQLAEFLQLAVSDFCGAA